MVGWLRFESRSAWLLLGFVGLLPCAPNPALPQQGLDRGFPDAVTLGKYVCGRPGAEAFHDGGQVLLAQPVTQAASSRYRWAVGLDGCRWLTTADRFTAFQQVGAEGGVQSVSRYPDQRTAR